MINGLQTRHYKVLEPCVPDSYREASTIGITAMYLPASMA
jgi:hypothetical protein